MGTGQEIGSDNQIHAVRFYDDVSDLTTVVSTFLGEGLAKGQRAVIIATPGHASVILAELARVGWDADTTHGLLLQFDAEEMLGRFMVGGTPDPWRFRHALTPVAELACGAPNGLRAYGEMVDVLWRAGNTAGATRLEALRNALANTHTFSLLCGYSLGNVYKTGAVNGICGYHSHVASSSGALTRAH